MGFLDEDAEDDGEPDTPDNLSELSSISDYRDEEEIDPRELAAQEEWNAMDEDERRECLQFCEDRGPPSTW